MNETFENQNWIVEIEIEPVIIGKMKINIIAKNKKTGEVIKKQYKTSLMNIKKTISQIKEDFGEYQ